MFPDRYSQIFGLGERLGCILNLSHSFDAIRARIFEFASMSITLAAPTKFSYPCLGPSNPAYPTWRRSCRFVGGMKRSGTQRTHGL